MNRGARYGLVPFSRAPEKGDHVPIQQKATPQQIEGIYGLATDLRLDRADILLTAYDQLVIPDVDRYTDLSYEEAERLLEWLRTTAREDPDYVRTGKRKQVAL